MATLHPSDPPVGTRVVERDPGSGALGREALQPLPRDSVPALELDDGDLLAGAELIALAPPLPPRRVGHRRRSSVRWLPAVSALIAALSLGALLSWWTMPPAPRARPVGGTDIPEALSEFGAPSRLVVRQSRDDEEETQDLDERGPSTAVIARTLVQGAQGDGLRGDFRPEEGPGGDEGLANDEHGAAAQEDGADSEDRTSVEVDRLLAEAEGFVDRGDPRAEPLLRSAVELDGRHPHALAAMAAWYLARNDGAEALRWAERAVNVRRRRASYRILKGDALAALGHEEEARSAYRRALVYQPDNAEALARLGIQEQP